MARKTWPWAIVAYYTTDPEVLKQSAPGRRGAQPGQKAFETKHKSESSADFELAAARSRPEIGEAHKCSGPY